MTKSRLEHSLNLLKIEIENRPCESEGEKAYMCIKVGMYLSLFDIYRSEYSNTVKDYIIFGNELLSLYIELRELIK